MADPKDKLFCSQSEACRMFGVSLPTLKRDFINTGKLTPVFLTTAETKPRPHFSLAEITELHDAAFAKAKVNAAKKAKRRAA
jgi:hypothetical protein